MRSSDAMSSLTPTEDQQKMLDGYERQAERYFGRGISAPEDTKEWLDRVGSELKLGMKVIEIGSANGWLADYYRPLGIEVECTDAVDAFVERMKELGRKTRKLNLFTDEFPLERYDCLIAISVLHHFTKEQLVVVLEKIRRGLKRNGLLAFRVRQGFGEEIISSTQGVPAFYRLWQVEELSDVVKKTGFSLIDIKSNKKGSHIVVLARKEPDQQRK